jgi:hypothetical protein
MFVFNTGVIAFCAIVPWLVVVAYNDHIRGIATVIIICNTVL